MRRREFLRSAGAAGLAAAGGPLLSGCWNDDVAAASRPIGQSLPLYRPPVVSPEGLVLAARPASAEIASGLTAPILAWGASPGPVGPTIEARTGQRMTVVLRNELDEPTITHWHGLRPPEAADGHPRLAIAPGGTYHYDFEVPERAGLYWYHPHPHMRTARQTYLGLIGLMVVRDSEEDALGLPAGERELLLVVQDKRRDEDGIWYAPSGHDHMEGFLCDQPFVNGVLHPRVEVASALYRVRVLNGSNARIFRLALSSGATMVLIGTEGGLLDAPVELPWVDVGTGERLDLLLDFSGARAGTTVSLRSLEFENPSRMGGMRMGRGMGMGGMGGGVPQGAPMPLLDFAVVRERVETVRIPATLPPLARLTRADAERERVFHFESRMMSHTINGKSFEIERVDERVPFGATEVWSFVNHGPFPHPVHMHAVHFQVLARSGGRGRVMPWERGLKDTVLVLPGERVDVIARFDRHPGLFLMHCHNLEHEDMGMMINFLIE